MRALPHNDTRGGDTGGLRAASTHHHRPVPAALARAGIAALSRRQPRRSFFRRQIMSSSFAIDSSRSLLALGLVAVAACDNADSWEVSTSNRPPPPGSSLDGGPLPAGGFVPDPNQGGLAT